MSKQAEIITPQVITLGCRLNAYESDVMRGHAKDAGLTNAVIINTCAVTNEAVRSSRYAIRKAKKDNPEASIIVTGCAAQIDPKAFAAMPEVDNVIGNAEKMLAASFEPETLLGGEPIKVNDIMAVRETAPQLISGGNRSFRKIPEAARGLFCKSRTAVITAAHFASFLTAAAKPARPPPAKSSPMCKTS